MKVENKRLKDQFHVQRKNLEKYAREYYLMGNECIIQAHDSRAAIANYDKAIELNPSYTDAWIRKGITLHNDKEYYEAEVRRIVVSGKLVIRESVQKHSGNTA